jgi:hypothetical protein
MSLPALGGAASTTSGSDLPAPRSNEGRSNHIAGPDVDPSRYAQLATDAQLDRSVDQLRKRGFEVVVVETLEEARREAMGRIPAGASVLDAASRSLEEAGILGALSREPALTLLRTRLRALDRATQGAEIRRVSQAPDVVIGSVHAVTEDGEVLVASATGNQIGPYSFGAGRVIWVVGIQKIVPSLADGIERIERYCLPLERARARAAYGRGSLIARILILRQDHPAGRTTVILVKHRLGF